MSRRKKNMCPHTSSHKSVTLLLWLFLFCTLDEEAIPTQSSGKNGKQIRAELSKSFWNFYSAQCTMGPKIILRSQFFKMICISEQCKYEWYLEKSKKNLKAFLAVDRMQWRKSNFLCLFWQEKQQQINKKLILIWKYP